jgi:sugar/nucleoside kinase (ribokinase family)
MPIDPPSVDLLVVGGLTVDRFADGSSAPGGTALHATRAASAVGLRVGVVTRCGDDTEARSALDELRKIAFLDAAKSRSSITFRHADVGGGARQLTLMGGIERLSRRPASVAPLAVLYGPVAGELGADLGGQRYPGTFTAAILQGWLRTLEPGMPVRQRPLTDIDAALVARLATLELLVASDEDLSAVARGAAAQLAALRTTFGIRPLLAVTEGPRGAWLESGEGVQQHIDPPRVVSGVPMTGAGDAFAAVLAARLAQGSTLSEAGGMASAAAVEYLERRLRP